jgi:hypothetical protein
VRLALSEPELSRLSHQGEALLSEQNRSSCLLFLSLVAVKTAVDFFGFFRVFFGWRSVGCRAVCVVANKRT